MITLHCAPHNTHPYSHNIQTILLTTCAAGLDGPPADMFLYSPLSHVTHTVNIRSHNYNSGVPLLIKAFHCRTQTY